MIRQMMQFLKPLQKPLVVSNKYKYPILAKPSGITLDRHRKDVMDEGQKISLSYPITQNKYLKKTGKNLGRRLDIIADHHDDGKNNEIWQDACQLDYESFIKWAERFGGNFQEYAFKNQGEAGKHLKKAGVRHEFQSLVINKSKNLPFCLQAAIAAHHAKLGFKFEDRWINEGVEIYWKAFQRQSNQVTDNKMSLAEVAKLHYEYAGPRGQLQLADHRASAIEDGDYVPEYIPFSYKFPHPEKRNVQKLIEQFWQDDLLLIRAATGAGKTDASLLWASKQIENYRAERVIIAMPTRFTSNALSINVAESLSNTGLYHSSAWFNKFQTNVEAGEISLKEASKEHEFARLLQTPVTVCTIDHLLIALTLTREDHHLITFNLANSCLVIDEADFYDDFTQANILVLLELLNAWNVPVLIMSASLPNSILPEYQRIGCPVKEIKEDLYDINEYKRTRFEIKSIKANSNIDDIEDLLQLILGHGHGIIYANTIDRAMNIYNWFSDKNIDSCLYHSRFTEPDKLLKEDILLKMLGKEAWANNTAHGVAILTQIGEMSINISADIMVSDVCPIDRLTQRAGRLSRFNKSVIGDLYILIPYKNEFIYPAPYGNYDRKNKCWINSKAFNKTLDIIKVKKYSAKKLVEMLNIVYDSEMTYSAIALSNANNLKDYFKINWLINSKQISNIDDSEVNFWKSRNITSQTTVFTSKPQSTYFSNYISFQSWKIKNSIELPIYVVEQGKRKFMIDIQEITIRDEVDHIYIVREGFYDSLKGIDFRTPIGIFDFE